VREVFWMLKVSFVKDEDVGEGGADEVDCCAEEPGWIQD